MKEVKIMENQIILHDDNGNTLLAEMGTTNNTYCSLICETDEQKKILFNLTANPQHKVSDMINKKIMLKDVYMEEVLLRNEETGEASQGVRIILIDDKQEGYVCVSKGIKNSLQKLFAIFGTPENWVTPIEIEIKQLSIKDRNILTFNAC